MPPARMIPPAKAVKTERTHEENQERAYIAASRRSDRSLEARVESARRASEIHKRRTGRSLRVTEQDVVNEEMYEEEDDDLPMQYRRLTAHLQTGSVDFNRRLAAYLTNQVAMRSAMDRMINNSYAQQYPNAPRFHHNNSHPALSPSINQSAANLQRSAPYPSPHQPSFVPNHGRSFSNTAVNDLSHDGGAQSSASQLASPHERRMSTPADVASNDSSRPLKTDEIKPEADHPRQSQSGISPMSNPYPPFWQDMSLFSTSLPLNSQQLLGPGLDPRDPMTSMLMAGSEQFTSSPYYPWGNMQSTSKFEATRPPFSGMHSTLAPSALEISDNLSSPAVKSGEGSKDESAAPSTGLDFHYDQDSPNFKGSGFGTGLTRENSAHSLGSGQITPGEGFWDSFVQDGGWSEEATGTK